MTENETLKPNKLAEIIQQFLEVSGQDKLVPGDELKIARQFADELILADLPGLHERAWGFVISPHPTESQSFYAPHHAIHVVVGLTGVEEYQGTWLAEEYHTALNFFSLLALGLEVQETPVTPADFITRYQREMAYDVFIKTLSHVIAGRTGQNPFEVFLNAEFDHKKLIAEGLKHDGIEITYAPNNRLIVGEFVIIDNDQTYAFSAENEAQLGLLAPNVLPDFAMIAQDVALLNKASTRLHLMLSEHVAGIQSQDEVRKAVWHLPVKKLLAVLDPAPEVVADPVFDIPAGPAVT